MANFFPRQTTEFKLEEDELLILSEKDILAILKK